MRRAANGHRHVPASEADTCVEPNQAAGTTSEASLFRSPTRVRSLKEKGNMRQSPEAGCMASAKQRDRVVRAEQDVHRSQPLDRGLEAKMKQRRNVPQRGGAANKLKKFIAVAAPKRQSQAAARVHRELARHLPRFGPTERTKQTANMKSACVLRGPQWENGSVALQAQMMNLSPNSRQIEVRGSPKDR